MAILRRIALPHSLGLSYAEIAERISEAASTRISESWVSARMRELRRELDDLRSPTTSEEDDL